MNGLKYVSFYGSSGYASAASAYMLALDRAGVPVTWHPMDFYGDHFPMSPCAADVVETDPMRYLLRRPIEYDTVLYHVIPHRSLPDALAREPGKKHLAYTTWETDRLLPHWVVILNQFDGILVPSHFNREVFLRSGVSVPVYAVPHLTAAWQPGLDDPAWAPAAGRFVFYTIGEWTNRKALWKVLDAYWRAFKPGEPVMLLIKTGRLNFTLATYRRYWHRLWLHVGTARLALAWHQVRHRLRFPFRLPPVFLVSTPLPPAAIEALHRRGDCFVSLSHGEGWGLGAFEAGQHGKPVIMTGWGGQLDFLSRELAYLVDCDLVPPRAGVDSNLFTPAQRWAEPNIEHAAALMRHVYTHRAEAAACGRALQQSLEANFQSSGITAQLLAALNA